MSELTQGIKAEKEHSDVIRFIDTFYKKHGKIPPKSMIYTLIAKAHLKENPKYYTKLKKYKL